MIKPASSGRKNKKEGGRHARTKTNRNYKQLQEVVNDFLKEKLELIKLKEREIYLEEHSETKANGYYQRSLRTKFGQINELNVLRTRDSEFKPALLPYRKSCLMDLGEFVLLLFASGLSFRNITKLLQTETVYGIYYSSSSISRLSEVLQKDIENFKNRKPKEYYPVIFIDCMFVNLRRANFEKEPLYIVMGIDEEGKRQILGFYLFGAEGETARNWKEVMRQLKERGLREVLIVISDELSGIEEAIKEEFP